MATTEQELRSLSRSLRDMIEAHPTIEPWQFDHDRAMRCRDLEEFVAKDLRLLEEVLTIADQFMQSAKDAGGINDDQLGEIAGSTSTAVARQHDIVHILDRFEQAGFSIEGGRRLRDAIHHLEGVESLLGRWRAPNESGGQTDGARPPRPESETDAGDDLYRCPPTLPLPEPSFRVRARMVDSWPFMPPITWRTRE